jgi:hypothetical protein
VSTPIRPVLLLLGAVALAACTQSKADNTIRALERSNSVSFVCLSVDAERDPGRSIDLCPDHDDLDEDVNLFALVTQTQRGEVAVVNLSAGTVVDSDPWIPGVTFLPVGENPVEIVSTPGGVASFVATAGGPWGQGIFALPSSCVTHPGSSDPRPDLALWPSCALPSAPGRMVILVDPPDESGRLRESCGSDYVEPEDLPAPLAADPPEALAAPAGACEADLRQEQDPPGRRKLLVTLPDVGEVWILDAQRLLDVPGGTFPACADVALEGSIALPTTVPEPLPTQQAGDLSGADECVPPLNFGPAPDLYASRPAGIDLRDGVLYVGDLGVPVLHRLDMADPCAPVALPPLVPRSFEEPGRAVFAGAVAASPATTTGDRYVYAVDDAQGSVMVFDVSPGVTDRTPIVRPGMRFAPFEVPDRLTFGTPVKDLEFAFRDLPAADPVTGVASSGVLCDPDPELEQEDPDAPALEHRPDGSYLDGARPSRLRGTFGFALLANGNVAVVDIEDLDAPCRRPIFTNPDPDHEDAFGCEGDPAVPGGLYTSDGTLDGDPTVTGELSCRVVERHRLRSARPFASTSAAGVSAPALRTFPQLHSPTGGSLPTNQTDAGLTNPKLLAVDFADGSPASMYLGTTLYRSGDPENPLETDPTVAERNGLGFYFREPRAFLPTDEVSVVYEGQIMAERAAGMLSVRPGEPLADLNDPGGGFCGRGVEDLDMATAHFKPLGIQETDQESFALHHADYVQITAAIPEEDDPYWDGPEIACGGGDPATSYYTCEEALGTPDEPQPARDLVIREAYQGHLLVAPRGVEGDDARAQLELLDCCFGGELISYRVRGGTQWVMTSSGAGFQHHVVARGGDLRCVNDCNPRRQLFNSRAFEIAPAAAMDPEDDSEIEACGPGECLACVTDEDGPVDPTSPCVFDGVTTRFAIYRGRARSERDMSFTWQMGGGFTPLAASLARTSSAVSPLSMTFVPQIQELAVTDGSAQGLLFVSLDGVTVHTSFD